MVDERFIKTTTESNTVDATAQPKPIATTTKVTSTAIKPPSKSFDDPIIAFEDPLVADK